MVNRKYIHSLLVVLVLVLSACMQAPDSEDRKGEPVSTPTPTEMAGGIGELQKTESRCSGLAGTLEVRLLVGPAEAAGMEPHAVGEIPFSVISASELFLIEGKSAIFYEDVLEEKWGTYLVFFDMDAAVAGECTTSDGEYQLDLEVEMTGEQLVEVQAQDFQGEYPWSGTQQIAFVLPLADDAEAGGEGWQFILNVSE